MGVFKVKRFDKPWFSEYNAWPICHNMKVGRFGGRKVFQPDITKPLKKSAPFPTTFLQFALQSDLSIISKIYLVYDKP